MAPLVRDEARPIVKKLLFYLARADDPQRMTVGPTLAGLCRAAGWSFECYYSDRRSGLHFGGGDVSMVERGRAAGGLVAGARHLEQAAALADGFEIAVLGDLASPVWPVLERRGAIELLFSRDPLALYSAAVTAMEIALPTRAVVVDPMPQGEQRLVIAPYLAPEFLMGAPCLGIDANGRTGIEELRASGVSSMVGMWLGPAARSRWEKDLDDVSGADATSYGDVTAVLARSYSGWGEGLLLADPDLAAAQLPRIANRKLIPLYGQPQSVVLRKVPDIVRRSREPVYGRQYDDHDFFTVSELGHGLQVLDPAPPFASTRGTVVPPAQAQTRVSEQINGRLPATLMFWAGMIREAECIARVIDLVAATGLRCGLIVTADTFRSIDEPSLAMLSVPPDQGGVGGLVELVLGSTGWGVAAESLLDPERLRDYLASALAELSQRLPAELVPQGWWPLLDTALVTVPPKKIGIRNGRPALFFTPREAQPSTASSSEADAEVSSRLRAVAARAVRNLGLESAFEPRRPFDDHRPGRCDAGVADAVKRAGLRYMWTKAAFGSDRPIWRDDDFLALPLTVGNWDGWSPFYTVSRETDLRRRRAGVRWLAGVIDTPLWLMSGEALDRSSELLRIARFVASGGRRGELVNVLPGSVADHARSIQASHP